MNKKGMLLIGNVLLVCALTVYAVALQSPGIVLAANVVQNSSFETAGVGGAADAANWTEGTLHARASDKFNTGAWSLKSKNGRASRRERQNMTIVASPVKKKSGYVRRNHTVGGRRKDMKE